jgi:iron complex transport system substrate-binding protein
VRALLPRRRLLAAIVLCAAAACGCDASGVDQASVEPGAGAAVRVVALAPHLAELVYAVGAQDALVGTSLYTDFPGYEEDLPVVGDAFAIDQERLALLEPDLLLAWASGTPAHVVDELRQQGYRVAVVRTRSLDDVPRAMEHIGSLTGNAAGAAEAAREFRAGMRTLAGDHAGAVGIRVFYQVSSRPLYTVNGEHYVSDLIETCGGANVFADLGELAPLVDVEAVLARDPEVLLASSDSSDAFALWGRWPALAANRYRNRFLVPADAIGRATPRLVQAGRVLCQILDRARRNREAAAG